MQVDFWFEFELDFGFAHALALQVFDFGIGRESVEFRFGRIVFDRDNRGLDLRFFPISNGKKNQNDQKDTDRTRKMPLVEIYDL